MLLHRVQTRRGASCSGPAGIFPVTLRILVVFIASRLTSFSASFLFSTLLSVPLNAFPSPVLHQQHDVRSFFAMPHSRRPCVGFAERSSTARGRGGRPG